MARGREGRYLFTFNYDTFNVEGMWIRGATTSCGLLSMVCLNLPPDICNKPKNMDVAGIIPGLHLPKETQLNHYLRPLIDDLEISWRRGVKYLQMVSYSEGCVTHSVITVAVMNLPAAQMAAQLAHPTAHIYCMVAPAMIGRCWAEWTTISGPCMMTMLSRNMPLIGKKWKVAENGIGLSRNMVPDTWSFGVSPTGIPSHSCQWILCIVSWRTYLLSTFVITWVSWLQMPCYLTLPHMCFHTISQPLTIPPLIHHQVYHIMKPGRSA